ncbi:J domain-containing protein [Halobacteriales archaeon Cl-PHB]
MGETFYTTLGVDPDADAPAIRSAYRDQVKARHPDVSDEPGAPREFKRITTARDVLTDEDERERYDRLGHDVYVRRHLDTSVWSADDAGGAAGDTDTATAAGRTTTSRASRRRTRTRSRAAGRDATDRSAWMGQDMETGQQRDRETRRTQRQHGDRDWWEASEVYTRSPPTADPSARSGGRNLGALFVQLGPWLAIHLVLLLSAVATGWFTYTRAERLLPNVLPAAAVGVLLIGLVVTLSALHLVSILYT